MAQLNIVQESALFIIILILGVIAFQQTYKMDILDKAGNYKFLSVFLFVLSFVMLQILTEKYSPYITIKNHISSIPLWLFLTITLCIAALEIVLYKKLLQKKETRLGSNAIKESLDNLPLGIGFSDSKGLPLLVNHKMEQISKEVCGEILLNIKDCKEKIAKSNPIHHNAIFRQDSYIIFKIHDQIWQMNTIDHGHIKETIAKDITREYLLIKKIREKNEKVEQLNLRLKNYNAKVDDLIREKEILKAKRKIHDDIGQSLITFRFYLQNSDKNPQYRSQLVNLCRQNIMLLKGPTETAKSSSNWEKLRKATQSVGISLVVKGNLPKEEKSLSILTEIVHEATNNAILYGNAKKITVKIREKKTLYTFIISNDGTRPQKPVVEKGGLKNMRKWVEMEGGTMTIKSRPRFLLEINLPKRGRYEL